MSSALLFHVACQLNARVFVECIINNTEEEQLKMENKLGNIFLRVYLTGAEWLTQNFC